MKNKTIIEVKDLAKEYIKQGYSYMEAVKRAEKEVREKENWKYGIYS